MSWCVTHRRGPIASGFDLAVSNSATSRSVWDQLGSVRTGARAGVMGFVVARHRVREPGRVAIRGLCGIRSRAAVHLWCASRRGLKGAYSESCHAVYSAVVRTSVRTPITLERGARQGVCGWSAPRSARPDGWRPADIRSRGGAHLGTHSNGGSNARTQKIRTEVRTPAGAR